MVRVKVCGITSLEDALVSAEAGADALGFNFWPKSKRYIEPDAAAAIVAELPPGVTPVGVFVDEEPVQVERVARGTGLRGVQLHGDESPETASALAARDLLVLKAFRVGGRFHLEELQKYEGVAGFLLDADVTGEKGGTGRTFDWSRAKAARRYGRILLAGGLTVENVSEAIRQAQPFGVDVCSGVENAPGRKDLENAPGRKDHGRLREFIRWARESLTL
jgi:phosphoribosylanthranilate isomerase